MPRKRGVCDLSDIYKRHDCNPIYRLYRNIKTRCYCKKHRCYKNYGGRGIYMCDMWLNNFRLFVDHCIMLGYKYGLECDRLDKEQGYNPFNIQFVTQRKNLKRQNKENIPLLKFIK